MKAENIKLAVFDLDGTLLADFEKLPDNFYEDVKLINSKGVAVAISSARPAVDIFRLFHKGVDGLMICGEDGNVYFEGEKLLEVRYIEQEAVDAVKKVTKGNPDVSVSYSSLTKKYLEEEDYDKFVKRGLKQYFPEGPVKLNKDDRIIKIHCSCDGGPEKAIEIIDTVFAELKKDYDIRETGNGTIGIVSKNSNKGEAVKFLMNYFDIGRENIVVFGDSENDIPMFKEAGYSFAMKNASDKVKSYADAVTDEDNLQGGAIKALKKLLNI